MGKRLMAVLLAAVLCLGLAGCGNGEEASSRPEEAAFSAETGRPRRRRSPSPSPNRILWTPPSPHDDTGLAIARLLGQELIVYPRYALGISGPKGYTDLPEEYLLLTALLGTDGTTPGITQGANTTEAQYVAKQLGRETGRRQFITKEQVEYAARELFGRGSGAHPPECAGGRRSPGTVSLL